MFQRIQKSTVKWMCVNYVYVCKLRFWKRNLHNCRKTRSISFILLPYINKTSAIKNAADSWLEYLFWDCRSSVFSVKMTSSTLKRLAKLILIGTMRLRNTLTPDARLNYPLSVAINFESREHKMHRHLLLICEMSLKFYDTANRSNLSFNLQH